MSPNPKPPAPHVQAALRQTAPVRPAAVQARPVASPANPAPHVQAATGRIPAPPVAPPVQARPAAPAPPSPARHVQAAVQKKENGSGEAGKEKSSAPAHLPPTQSGDFTVYEDRKTPGINPPPPRWPVYALHCSDKGPCVIEDVKTGRTREAGTVYGGFVRMSRSGPVYISPRPDLGFPGDSHPTIAAGTPDGMRGKRALVAAGEIGIVNGEIVGHNDKTGHYMTRRNLYQSGLPAEKYHPFTEDPREWYRKPR
jgi:hypothetical protein